MPGAICWVPCARHLLGTLGILYHSIFTTALWKMHDYSLYAEEETGIGGGG